MQDQRLKTCYTKFDLSQVHVSASACGADIANVLGHRAAYCYRSKESVDGI
jgi:hypothetical protein